jgi:hypothetical protein
MYLIFGFEHDLKSNVAAPQYIGILIAGGVVFRFGVKRFVCSSVADPGCFIPDPDPTIAPSLIRIPDPGGKKAPDPGYDLFLYKGY